MFRVRWQRQAADELTDLWTRASSVQRRAITRASHLVEQRLRTDPSNEGESRPDGRRITFALPLAVTFRVEADGQTVSVLEVRLLRRRQS